MGTPEARNAKISPSGHNIEFRIKDENMKSSVYKSHFLEKPFTAV